GAGAELDRSVAPGEEVDRDPVRRDAERLRVLLPEVRDDGGHGEARAAASSPAVAVTTGSRAVEGDRRRVLLQELVSLVEAGERAGAAVDAERPALEARRDGKRERLERRVVRVGHVRHGVAKADERLPGEGGDAQLVRDALRVPTAQDELALDRTLPLDLERIPARCTAALAADRERGKRDRTGQPCRARRDAGEERRPGPRDREAGPPRA